MRPLSDRDTASQAATVEIHCIPPHTKLQPFCVCPLMRTSRTFRYFWPTWRSPAGERIRSFTIATTTPNELCAELHNWMPVVLKPQSWPLWLGEQPATVPDLKALLAPYPSDDMVCWPVSTRVGNVKNSDPALIEPIILQ
jgi:putative SOS response-associated peptidase YedK